MVQNTKNKKEKIMLQKLVLPKDRYVFVLETLIQMLKEATEEKFRQELKDLKEKTIKLEKSRIELVKKFTKEINSLEISDLGVHRLRCRHNTEYSDLLHYDWPYQAIQMQEKISFLEKELKIVKMSSKEIFTSDIIGTNGYDIIGNDILGKLYYAYMQKYNKSLLEENNGNKQKDNKKIRKSIVNNGQ